MRTVSNVFLYIFAFGVAGYAAFAYSLLPLGSLVHPDMRAAFLAHPTGIYTHAFAAMLTLALGPLQFSSSLRRKYPEFHRWCGRIYLAVGVLVGGAAGLYMAQYAFGGPAAKLGFAVLAVLWLYTGLCAYLAARRGNFGEHRKWMLRNFSLTFAAVTLRIYLPIAMISGFEFAAAYAVIAWLCWVPNIVWAEWRYNVAPANELQPASALTRHCE